MRRSRSCAMAFLAALLCLAAPAPTDPLPAAREIVVRGKTTFAAALQAALAPARETNRAGLEVAVIVDVTPYTLAAEKTIMEGLRDLDKGRVGGGAAWRIAALGGKFGNPIFSAGALALDVPRVLREKRASENTFTDLERTIATLPNGHAAVVYLADWDFEDDHHLERLAGVLERRSLSFSVVGSEAAFSRAWNDGFFASMGSDARGGGERYDPRIGRDPFGTCRPESPWHGGDTAYPHLPAHMAGAPWRTEFMSGELAEDYRMPAFDPDTPLEGMEDLRERLRQDLPPSQGESGAHPLPSSFGPYGLMRLAALTGGRYVLWSWNPSGRSSVRYDYGHCDRFPPDLRPRSAILAELARRPLARAMLDAWHGIADRRVGLARITPPVAKDRVSPREMAETRSDCSLCMSWQDEAQYRKFLRDIVRVLDALDECIGTLDAAIERASERPDDGDLRLLADAHLFRHMLVVQRFSLGEAAEVAKHIPSDAWDHPDLYPALFCDEFLLRGSDPAKVIPRTERIFDREQAERVTEDRKFMLQRYRGTPFGETVARNEVVTYRFGFGRKVICTPGDGVRNPAQSEKNEGPTTRPGGGSQPAPPPTSGG